MMKMKTSRGAEFDVNYTAPMSGGKEMIVSLESSEKLSVIATELEGCEMLTVTDERRPGAKEVFEGYKVLMDIRRMNSGSVRATLGREG